MDPCVIEAHLFWKKKWVHYLITSRRTLSSFQNKCPPIRYWSIFDFLLVCSTWRAFQHKWVLSSKWTQNKVENGETAVCLVWGLGQILFVPSVGYLDSLFFFEFLRLYFSNQIVRFGVSTFCYDRMDSLLNQNSHCIRMVRM